MFARCSCALVALVALSSRAFAATPFVEFELGRGTQDIPRSETGLTIVLDGTPQALLTPGAIDYEGQAAYSVGVSIKTEL